MRALKNSDLRSWTNLKSESGLQLFEENCDRDSKEYEKRIAKVEKDEEKKNDLRIKVTERYGKLPKWWAMIENGDSIDDIKVKLSKAKGKK